MRFAFPPAARSQSQSRGAAPFSLPRPQAALPAMATMSWRALRMASSPAEGLPATAAGLGWAHLATRMLSWLSGLLWGLWRRLPSFRKGPGAQRGSLPEAWESCAELRVYRGAGAGQGGLLTVHTTPYSFQVDLAQLAAESAYFQALARSHMQEATEGHLRLPHVPSSAFRAILEWVFLRRFSLAEEEQLLAAVQSASYLLLPGFLDQCRAALRPLLSARNCLSVLHFAEAVGCPELLAEAKGYLSAHLLELAGPITGQLAPGLREELAQLRRRGPARLCVLRKENVSVPPRAELEALGGLYWRPLPPEEGAPWCWATQLPFRAEKWSFSAAQTLNYLFLVGGYCERRGSGARGFTFRMAAFRYNPLAGTWQPTATPSKRRRHFSMAVVGHHIYAIGGWYLDSLLAPDTSTCLYTAVERYDPWADSWAAVSSLPTGDFSFAVSLSHDLPLCTAHGGSIYALGSVQRTGEKLLLQYEVATDTWQELLPTLTHADADLHGLYFLGGTEPLFVVGSSSTQDAVVTSFCLHSRHWGPVRSLPKCSLAGQGLAVGGVLYMAAPDLGAVLEVELAGTHWGLLPAPPFPLSYEAFFLLHFPPATPVGEAAELGGPAGL